MPQAGLPRKGRKTQAQGGGILKTHRNPGLQKRLAECAGRAEVVMGHGRGRGGLTGGDVPELEPACRPAEPSEGEGSGHHVYFGEVLHALKSDDTGFE